MKLGMRAVSGKQGKYTFQVAILRNIRSNISHLFKEIIDHITSLNLHVESLLQLADTITLIAYQIGISVVF